MAVNKDFYPTWAASTDISTVQGST